jgi:alginate O-acetyltransferase complex protein AlgI
LLFNTWPFFVFLAITLTLYYVLEKRWQNYLLLITGYVFYGFWDWRFCGLLLLTTIFDYGCGRLMETVSERHRKPLLLFSVVANLGILGFFKYFNFFVDSAASMLAWFGFQANMPVLQVILPVGISFYTFQSMSYVIDVYRRDIRAEKSFVLYATYVVYFPQLVAGPIERAPHLLGQLREARTVDGSKIAGGLTLIVIGMFKKMAIADSVAGPVETIFADPTNLKGIVLLKGLWLFSLQIYGDFSGYTDIARGVSRLMGIELMENFNQPYLSRNITEFWRRWHISLSTWLRDYLYIPLGGNRGGTAFVYRNLFLTMVIGGLWHGANWTFVIWGALHGVYLSVHKFLLSLRSARRETVKHSGFPVVQRSVAHELADRPSAEDSASPAISMAGGTPATVALAGAQPLPATPEYAASASHHYEAVGAKAVDAATAAAALHGAPLPNGDKPVKAATSAKIKKEPWTLWGVLMCLGTFHLVMLTWVFFRAENASTAFAYLYGILTMRGGLSGALPHLATIACYVVMVLAVDLPQYRSGDHTIMLKWHWLIRGVAVALMILLIVLLAPENETPFIYFQF